MLYEARVNDKARTMFENSPCILGIETSCDDTSASVVNGGRDVRSLCINSQILLHRQFGGVVPEIASRNHVKNVRGVVQDALDEAGITIHELDAIAVTSSPGLLGALLTGVSFAKSLAFALDIPLVGVNHIAGHISANYLSNPELEPPFVCLVASGGHSQIVNVIDYMNYEVLGGTCDDAAGESLDKIARVLGLPYPGGVYLEKLAYEGNDNAYNFKSQYNAANHTSFSFSGIKTAVINLLQNANSRGETISNTDIAASFQRTIVDTLVYKTLICAHNVNAKTIAVAGGVSANLLLRDSFAKVARENDMDFYCPELKYCTDNASMIACAGYYILRAGKQSWMTLDARASGDLSKIFD